jgi:hypothetical protein
VVCYGTVKVKVKLSLCFNWSPRHEGVLVGSGGIAPWILDLGTRWRWVVSFTPRPRYPQGNSPWYPFYRRLCGPQSRSGRGGEEKNSQPLPGLQSPGHPARNPALYHGDISTPVMTYWVLHFIPAKLLVCSKHGLKNITWNISHNVTCFETNILLKDLA